MISENRNFLLEANENFTSPNIQKAASLLVDGTKIDSDLMAIIEKQQKIIEILEKELESIPEIIIRYQSERKAFNERFTHSGKQVQFHDITQISQEADVSCLKCPNCIGNIFQI